MTKCDDYYKVRQNLSVDDVDIQWSLFNVTTNGAPKSGRINMVVVLTGFLNKKITDIILVRDNWKWWSRWS